MIPGWLACRHYSPPARESWIQRRSPALAQVFAQAPPLSAELEPAAPALPEREPPPQQARAGFPATTTRQRRGWLTLLKRPAKRRLPVGSRSTLATFGQIGGFHGWIAALPPQVTNPSRREPENSRRNVLPPDSTIVWPPESCPSLCLQIRSPSSPPAYSIVLTNIYS